MRGYAPTRPVRPVWWTPGARRLATAARNALTTAAALAVIVAAFGLYGWIEGGAS